MSTTKTYTWNLEEISKTGQVISHGADLNALSSTAQSAGLLSGDFQIALYLEIGNAKANSEDFAWAYVRQGELPDVFDNTPLRIPKYVRAALQKAVQEQPALGATQILHA